MPMMQMQPGMNMMGGMMGQGGPRPPMPYASATGSAAANTATQQSGPSRMLFPSAAAPTSQVY